MINPFRKLGPTELSWEEKQPPESNLFRPHIWTSDIVKRYIVLFCGHIGSGKDTAAKYFIENHGFSQSKMSGDLHRTGSLKRTVFEIFDLDLERIEDREYRETPHENLGGATPRKALQYFGHQTRSFYRDVWVNNTIKHIRSLGNDSIVISDIRYLNEYEAIKKMENEKTKVRLVNVHNPRLDMSLEVYNDPSEEQIPVINQKADIILRNDGTLEELNELLEDVYKRVTAEEELT